VAGGNAYSPSNFGIGADPGHHEHRRPSTNVPTEASGWRSTVRKSIARLVPQSGQKTSSHGVPAISAALIVGDHNISRPVAKCRFQRSTTSSASRRVARSALSLAAPALMSSPHDGYRLRVRRWGATVPLFTAAAKTGADVTPFRTSRKLSVTAMVPSGTVH
jgi:hypothetical protein